MTGSKSIDGSDALTLDTLANWKDSESVWLFHISMIILVV